MTSYRPTPVELDRACAELARLLIASLRRMDERGWANGGVEECTAGLCYESEAA